MLFQTNRTIDASGNFNFERLRKGESTSVKELMMKRTEGETIRNDARAICLVPTNMSGIKRKRNIVQSKIEATNSATITISTEHFLAKSRIALRLDRL